MPAKTGLAGLRMPKRQPSNMAQIGTTEHAVLVMVVLELAALVAIRRVFKSAHGG